MIYFVVLVTYLVLVDFAVLDFYVFQSIYQKWSVFQILMVMGMRFAWVKVGFGGILQDDFHHAYIGRMGIEFFKTQSFAGTGKTITISNFTRKY